MVECSQVSVNCLSQWIGLGVLRVGDDCVCVGVVGGVCVPVNCQECDEDDEDGLG